MEKAAQPRAVHLWKIPILKCQLVCVSYVMGLGHQLDRIKVIVHLSQLMEFRWRKGLEHRAVHSQELFDFL